MKKWWWLLIAGCSSACASIGFCCSGAGRTWQILARNTPPKACVTVAINQSPSSYADDPLLRRKFMHFVRGEPLYSRGFVLQSSKGWNTNAHAYAGRMIVGKMDSSFDSDRGQRRRKNTSASLPTALKRVAPRSNGGEYGRRGIAESRQEKARKRDALCR